jgi:hypothetical protein
VQTGLQKKKKKKKEKNENSQNVYQLVNKNIG